MQCCSCQFENMPGTQACARCGASMMLVTATINVHPPRAGQWDRSLPRFWLLRRNLHGLRCFISAGFTKVASGACATNFDARTLLKSVVPGLVQSQRGAKTRGRLFFWGYAALFLMGSLLCGTAGGSFFLGLAFAVHVTSTADALVTGFASFRDRMSFSLLCGLLLFFALYCPIGWCVTRVATPVRLCGTWGCFKTKTSSGTTGHSTRRLAHWFFMMCRKPWSRGAAGVPRPSGFKGCASTELSPWADKRLLGRADDCMWMDWYHRGSPTLCRRSPTGLPSRFRQGATSYLPRISCQTRWTLVSVIGTR